MYEQTRIVRLGGLVERDDATNTGTVVRNLRLDREWFNLKALFKTHQREMALALEAERRPGVTIFVLAPGNIEGRLWLAATEEPRSGSIGRHGSVDLFLPKDGGLSLRHCLALVRRVGDGLRIHVVDLSSSAGLQTEGRERVHAVSADGHFFLAVPGSILAFFPTGTTLPWKPDALDPFESLAPRKLSKQLQEPRPLWRASQPRESDSRITVMPRPVEAKNAGDLLLRGEVPEGSLSLVSPAGSGRVPVGRRALDGGIVLGRYSRCVGNEVLGDDRVSRVHALLLRLDKDLVIADAGSTNGTWIGEEEIKCARLQPLTTYTLGDQSRLRWEPVH